MFARGPRRNPNRGRGYQGREIEFEKKQHWLSITIELGPDLKGNSIKEIAMNARKEIGRIMIDEKFIIVGYSFGVNIALELAAILENEGNTGVIHCIDSSPEALRETIETVLGRVSEDQLQNHVLNHMYNLITKKMGKELKRDLKSIPTFDAKVEECLRRMQGQVKLSEEHRRLILESAYRRIVMAQEYKPEIMLRSELVLKKSSKNMVIGKLPNDYDLSKYSQEPVKVSPLIASDYDTSYNPRVTNIVNLFIDEKKKWDVISGNKYVRVYHLGILNPQNRYLICD